MGALYRKHGWPGENFDGEAFLVDHVRHKTDVKYVPGEMWPSQKQLTEKREQDKAAALQTAQKFAGAETVDQEWVARWEIWNAEQTTCEMENAIRRNEELMAWGKTLQKTEGLPLREFEAVRSAFEWEQRNLEQLKQDLEVAEAVSQPEIQKRIRYAEQRTTIHQKAHMAS